jgi:hypothetical protein
MIGSINRENIMKKITMTLALGLASISAFAVSPAMLSAQTTKAAMIPTEIKPPPAGMGQVVFFRPSAMGMAISCNIREDGKMLGTTNNGRYWVLNTTPGVHKFTTKSEAKDEINVQVEADETVYVKCKIAAGIMAGRPNLSPSTKEEFEDKAPKMKLTDPDKMAKAIAKDEAKNKK